MFEFRCGNLLSFTEHTDSVQIYWSLNILRIQQKRFVPLGVTVYRNPPAFDLTEFGIWNFDVQRQFGNPDLHLQLGPQVTVREVQQHSDPSSHLLAIHVDVITPVWYLRAEKRMSVMEKWEKNSGLIFSGHISELHITKINTIHLNKYKVYLKWIGSEVLRYWKIIYFEESALTLCQKLMFWYQYLLELWFKTKNWPQQSLTQI